MNAIFSYVFWRFVLYFCLLWSLFIILQRPQPFDTRGSISTLFTVVLCRQWFHAKPGCMCFDTVLNAWYRANLHRLQPESVSSHNTAIRWCATFSLIWMTKSLQTGWYCTYLTSTHWHGNPAAFSWRCHFPTSSREFHAASRGLATDGQPGRGAMAGRRGCLLTLRCVFWEVCRMGRTRLSF